MDEPRDASCDATCRGERPFRKLYLAGYCLGMFQAMPQNTLLNDAYGPSIMSIAWNIPQNSLRAPVAPVLVAEARGRAYS